MEIEARPPEPFGKHVCLFAYEAVRATAESQLARWLEREANGDGREVIELLWKQAGSYCRERGEPGLDVPTELACERIARDGFGVLWIGLPEPTHVPEPGGIAVAFREGDDGPELSGVYFCEKAHGGTGYVLARMAGGSHAVLGSLFSADRDELLEQVEARESGHAEEETGFYGNPALEQAMAFSHFIAWMRGGDDAPEPDDEGVDEPLSED